MNLDKQVLRCFHGECAVQGNVLDLWVARQRLPLDEAALDLAKTFYLQIDPNGGEESVRPIPRKPR